MSRISYCKDMSALKKASGCWLLAHSHLLIAICSLLIANLFILTSPVLAVNTSPFQKLDSNNYNDSIGTQRFFRNQLIALDVVFLGFDPTGGPIYSEEQAYITKNGQTQLTSVPGLTNGSINNGALGMLGSTVIALYNPPTSSIEYLANLGENIGIAPKNAYAQQSVSGSGASVIQPVLALWQVMRNVAYVGFILVFITAGVMIMFRQKLNPQTVIGIQQALPGLIIGLIMVTFSYFIAAFIVDLTFVGMRLVAAVFDSTNTKNFYNDNTGSVQKTYQDSNAMNMYGAAATRVQNVSDMMGGAWGIVGPKNAPVAPGSSGVTTDIFKNIISGAAVGAGAGIIAPGVGNVAGGIIGGIIGAAIGLIGAMSNVDAGQAVAGGAITLLSSLLIPVILMIALMIQFIRLIIALLMSYIQILVMVIFGPFLILFSAIPGKGGVLGYWLKALLGNVLVFPAVFAGFLFAGLLLESDIGGVRMPLFGGISTEMIRPLLAFGVLLGLPSIPDMVREALGVKGPKGFTQAALGGFMGGVGVGKVGLGQVTASRGRDWETYQKSAAEAKFAPGGAAAAPVPPRSGTRIAGRVRGWLGIH